MLNQIHKTKPTNLNPQFQAYQTIYTKQNLPNQTKFTKTVLPNQT